MFVPEVNVSQIKKLTEQHINDKKQETDPPVVFDDQLGPGIETFAHA